MSNAQRALWFDWIGQPQSATYNISTAIRLTGELDIAALSRAFQALVDRHPMLRTSYRLTNQGLRQHIARSCSYPLVHTDARGWSDAMLDASVRSAHGRPFDLARGPVCRCDLFTRSDREHVLLLACHHIVVDGRSLIGLLGELPELYTASREGRTSAPPSGAPYLDAVRLEEARLAHPGSEQSWRYWSRILADAPALLELPLDRPRPIERDFEGADLLFELQPSLVESLESLARREGTSVLPVVLAAFQTLLFRYTNQEDFLMGTPAAGRPPGFEKTIGHFVNPLVLRVRATADMPFRVLLAQARQSVSEGLSHQYYPFPLLVERLQTRRDPSHAPLFQVSFVPEPRDKINLILPFPAEQPLRFADLEAEPVYIPQMLGTYDLTLMLGELAGGIAGTIKYRTALFEEATIRRMAGHLRTLLEGVVANPDATLAELPLLAPAERQEILAQGSGPKLVEPFRSIPALVDAWAERAPQMPAAWLGTEVLTYAELRRRSDALAATLRGLGVGSEARVGLLLERGPGLLVAQLAVLKSGGALLPMEPLHPRQRLERTLALGDPCLVLVDEPLRHLLPATHVPVLDLRALETLAISPDALASVPDSVGPEDLAYVLFTSGSTGEPKGVMGLHKGLANLGRSGAAQLNMAPGQRVLAFASTAFDGSLWEIYTTLVGGGTLHFATREELSPGLPLLEVLRSRRITSTWLPPAVLASLPDAELPDLEVLNTAGEPCTAAIVARWAPGRTFYNSYGPTECTVTATMQACEVRSRPPALGFALPGVQVYVLDARMQPVPRGVAGELYIGGEGVARGYIGRPDLTAERFLPDPFTTESGRRLYRTGDRARFTHDGELEFLGRVDRQVKIRGVRIEPGEVEACLAQHPAVAGQVVLAREDGPLGRQLVAYVATRERAEVTATQLRAFLSQKLPDAFVPVAYVVLPRLPLTASGKVDVSSLPAPELRPPRQASGATPRTALERELVSLWAEVLHLEQVGVDDNFFDLGGHSLLLMQLHQRLSEELGLSVRVVDLFRFPTVAALARHLQRAHPGSESVRRGGERGHRQRLAAQAWREKQKHVKGGKAR